MEGRQTVQYVEMAYARVSTKKQSLERQEASILETIPDLRAQYFFEDKYTGKEFDRPEYKRLKEKIMELKEANPNTRIRITIHELDRIGRDYQEIQKEVQWFRQQGVTLRFLDIPEGIISDAMGITGELLVDIIILLKAYWAEQERHKIREAGNRDRRETILPRSRQGNSQTYHPQRSNAQSWIKGLRLLEMGEAVISRLSI